MDELQDQHPVRHAVAWIGSYIIAVNIGEYLSKIVMKEAEGGRYRRRPRARRAPREEGPSRREA